jgi:hypothetical protein
MLGQNWRQIARQRFQAAPEGAWRDLPITDKQRAILQEHDADDPTMTRGAAFDLIRTLSRPNPVRIRRTAT